MTPLSHSKGLLLLSLTVLFLLAFTGCKQLKRFLYEGFGRDRWQQPAEVIDALDLEGGENVADIGSGGGYFTFRLADAVAPGGRVYAADVDSEMIAFVSDMAIDRGYDAVLALLAEFNDPLLPTGEIDLVFTCNTYHHLQNRSVYFRNIRKALS